MTAGRSSSERGAVPIEFAVGIAVLLVPTLVLVLSLPQWVERTSLATAVAREAGRAVVVAPTAADGIAAAHALAATMTVNHGLDPQDVTLCLVAHPADVPAPSGCGSVTRLERGMAVTTRVTVALPGTRIPAIGTASDGFQRTVTHTEEVDRYRSLP